jgi:hypothetical protein
MTNLHAETCFCNYGAGSGQQLIQLLWSQLRVWRAGDGNGSMVDVGHCNRCGMI